MMGDWRTEKWDDSGNIKAENTVELKEETQLI